MNAPAPPSPELTPETEATPWALVQGQAVTELPQDLYIPPDALEVFLEVFEGPLDLLLYLIKRQNLDVLDIPIARITQQYMDYIGLMQDMRFELAAEYLLMAAVLAEIKSRMLLPRQVEGEEDEGDPRAELVRRLQEYERFKTAAENLDGLPRMERELHAAQVEPPVLEKARPEPEVDLRDLLMAMQEVMQRQDLRADHAVTREPLSVRDRMSQILAQLDDEKYVMFTEVLSLSQGRLGVVVSFLATLELVKAHVVELQQTEAFAPIYLRTRAAAAHAPDLLDTTEFD